MASDREPPGATDRESGGHTGARHCPRSGREPAERFSGRGQGGVMTTALPIWAQYVSAFGPIVLSLVLVWVTWRYTRHTGRMVSEMRAAREAEVTPLLIPLIRPDPTVPNHGYISV